MLKLLSSQVNAQEKLKKQQEAQKPEKESKKQKGKYYDSIFISLIFKTTESANARNNEHTEGK